MLGANDAADIGALALWAIPGAAARLDAGYELRLRVGRDAVDARVASLRAPGALKIAEGRTVAEAVGLAGMLYPRCATAQTAAALSAAEAALRVPLTPAQTAARQLLVGFEAAASCAWRMGMAWPQLTGAEPQVEWVQRARAAFQAAPAALYADGEWARIGGGIVRPHTSDLFNLIDEVRDALHMLAPAIETITEDAPPIIGFEMRAWQLLDQEKIERAAAALAEDPEYASQPHLFGRPLEESPRALLGMWRVNQGLSTWFDAQARFADKLPGHMERALSAVERADPVPATLKGSGRGWGMAATSRGRILHWIAVDHGVVDTWRALEPSDWNFAPKGPVARAFGLLPADMDLVDAGRWIVAAFDPSAPCRVVVREELEE